MSMPDVMFHVSYMIENSTFCDGFETRERAEEVRQRLLTERADEGIHSVSEVIEMTTEEWWKNG